MGSSCAASSLATVSRKPSQLDALNLPSWTVRCTHLSCSCLSFPCAAENSTFALTSAKPEQSSKWAGAFCSGSGYLPASNRGNTKADLALRTSICRSSVATEVASSANDSSIRWNRDANSSALPPCSTRHACRICSVQDWPRAVKITVFVCASASKCTQVCSRDINCLPMVWLQRRIAGSRTDRFAKKRMIRSSPVSLGPSPCQFPQRQLLHGQDRGH